MEDFPFEIDNIDRAVDDCGPEDGFVEFAPDVPGAQYYHYVQTGTKDGKPVVVDKADAQIECSRLRKDRSIGAHVEEFLPGMTLAVWRKPDETITVA